MVRELMDHMISSGIRLSEKPVWWQSTDHSATFSAHGGGTILLLSTLRYSNKHNAHICRCSKT